MSNFYRSYGILFGIGLATSAAVVPFAAFELSQPGHGVNRYYRELHESDAPATTAERDPWLAENSIDATASHPMPTASPTESDVPSANTIILPAVTIIANPPTLRGSAACQASLAQASHAGHAYALCAKPEHSDPSPRRAL